MEPIKLPFEDWIVKFYQFAPTTPGPVYDMRHAEAQVEMGKDVSRWIDEDTYLLALGYLIAHLCYLAEKQEAGDHTAAQPLRGKEVDDVMVEFAVSRDMKDSFDPYNASSYGQQYVKWRRLAFGGPRVA